MSAHVTRTVQNQPSLARGTFPGQRPALPGPDGDVLLNLSAISVDFDVNYWTLWKRQQRGWPSLGGGKLVRHSREWNDAVGASGGYEDYFLKSQVERALQEPEAADGRYQLATDNQVLGLPAGSYVLNIPRTMGRIRHGPNANGQADSRQAGAGGQHPV